MVASILDGNGGTLSALLRALEWFADPYRSAHVVNLSIGIKHLPEDHVKMLERTVYQVTLMDVLCIAAVGNEAGESAFPGKLDCVLSAGAIDRQGRVWAYSGLDPDLVLPGVEIYSSIPAGVEDHFGASYAYCTGTSCAAAHLSGLAALVMQACPHAGPLEVADALKRTASGRRIFDKTRGWGEPDPLAAIDLLHREAGLRNGG